MVAISLSGQTKQRQVVILAVGGLVLAALLMFQVPRMLDMMKTKTPPPPPVEQTQATATATPSPSPVTPVAPVSTLPSRGLASLVRFKSKDPFVQQVGANEGAASSAPATSSQPSPSTAGSEESASAPSFTTVQSRSSSSAPTSAKIAVNGVEESVSVSDSFPKDNPVFRLVSLKGETAKVGISGGTLKGGSETVTLTKGEPLTLLNTVDGKRYKLELISLG